MMSLTDEQIQRLLDMTLWDLRPYRDLLTSTNVPDMDAFLTATLQRPARLDELPPPVAENVKMAVRQYLCRCVGHR